MPRKPGNPRSTAASSAAAAQVSSSTPTFTSFAAATAQVLAAQGEEYGLGKSSSSSSSSTSSWDEAALILMKKLTKRDATTKTRALGELVTHLRNLPRNEESVGGITIGRAFVNAWTATFSGLLDDVETSVRVAVLDVMRETVKVLGRRTQSSLSSSLPPWVAATGDSSSIVSAAALSTLNDAFPPPLKRERVARKFSDRLCLYCSQLVQRLASGVGNKAAQLDEYTRDARRIIAILQWMLNATNDLSILAPIIDDRTDPGKQLFRLVSKVPKQKKSSSNNSTSTTAAAANAVQTRAAVDLAIDIVRSTKRAMNETGSIIIDQQTESQLQLQKTANERLSRIVDFACALGKTADAAAWDVFLVLLSDVPDAMKPSHTKLSSALSSAAATGDGAALVALLPIVAAAGHPDFAQTVLTPMHKQFFPSSTKGSNPSTAFVLTAFPAFVEVVTFVLTALRPGGVWSNSKSLQKTSETEIHNIRHEWASRFALPIVKAFSAGILPPVAQARSDGTQPRRNATIGPAPGGASDVKNEEVTSSVARLVKLLASSAFPKKEMNDPSTMDEIADSVISNVGKRNPTLVVARFANLLDTIADSKTEGILAKAVIQRILRCRETEDRKLMSSALHIASVILMIRAGSMLLDEKCCGDGTEKLGLVREVVSMAQMSIDSLFNYEVPSDDDDDNNVGKSLINLENVATHLATMYSWVLWALNALSRPGEFDKTLAEIRKTTRTKDHAFHIFAQLLRTHEKRKAFSYFSPCPTLPSTPVKEIIFEAVDEGINMDSGIQLLVAAIETNLPASCVEHIVSRVTTHVDVVVTTGNSNNQFNALIIALLRSTHVQKQTGKIGEENQIDNAFMSAAFKLAVKSSDVMTAFAARLSALPVPDTVSLINSLIVEIRTRMEKDTEDSETDVDIDGENYDDDEGDNHNDATDDANDNDVLTKGAYRQRGEALTRLISELAERDVAASVVVSAHLLSTDNIPASIVQAFLMRVPLTYIFGDGTEKAPVAVKQLVTCLQHDDQFAQLLERIPTFLESLSSDGVCKVACNVTDAILDGSCPRGISVVKAICTLESSESSYVRTIAGRIERVFNKGRGETSISAMRHAAYVVHATRGRFIDEFIDALKEVVTVIRRDPTSDAAYCAMDVLCAAAGSATSSVNTNKSSGELVDSNKIVPDWLQEYLVVTMRAVRRCLEMPRGISPQSLDNVEAHGAEIVYFGIRSGAAKQSDDARFWRMRMRLALQKFVKKTCRQHKSVEIAQCKCVAWMCRLVDVLVNNDNTTIIPANDDDAKVDEATEIMNDEMAHWGAWCAVHIIPNLEEHSLFIDDYEIDDVAYDVEGLNHERLCVYDHVNADGCASLILKAAERGVLLGKDGDFPVARSSVYEIAPWLRSNGATLRKAVLALLAHAAAVDLPEQIASTFPKSGFRDEAHESDFALNALPAPLRKALEWDSLCTQLSTHEVGFFLGWRLLLDLMHGKENSSTSTENGSKDKTVGNEDEDVSVRRVSVTFFRTEGEQLFKQFLARCVDVVVDGSEIERKSAAQAAQTALQLEQPKPQGIQLAQQTEEKQDQSGLGVNDGEKNDNPERDMETQVGRAAGIALARALQRVPALFRDTLMRGGLVDRGALSRTESFVRLRISPLLIAAEVQKVREWGAFGGGGGSSSSNSNANNDNGFNDGGGFEEDGEVEARGSVAGRECWATYHFSDVKLEIAVRLPESFPLRTAVVEARSRVGMSEARWRKTVLAMTTLLQVRNGAVAEAVQLWRRNLDETFRGKEECPICYSVLHMSTAALPRMQCRTCRKLFHADCLCKWFTKSNSSACPLCRSAF